MDIDFIMLTLTCGLLVVGLDIAFIILLFKGWIKEKRLISDFPSWEDTKKPLRWWFIWSGIILTNLIAFIVYCLIYGTMEATFTSLKLITPIYSGIIGFIYICVKNALKEKYMKS